MPPTFELIDWTDESAPVFVGKYDTLTRAKAEAQAYLATPGTRITYVFDIVTREIVAKFLPE